jgi:anti-sigma factor (TIGR02949 family)
MDCGKALQQLFDFLDGELTPERMALVRQHIDGCGHCLDHAEFERRFLKALNDTKEHRCCPEAVRAKVLSSLQAAGLRLS